MVVLLFEVYYEWRIELGEVVSITVDGLTSPKRKMRKRTRKNRYGEPLWIVITRLYSSKPVTVQQVRHY